MSCSDAAPACRAQAADAAAAQPAALTRVWACGSNPLVAYPGSGAYFLDRAAPGVWRLQLYPDVFTVADPYTGSPEPKVRLIPGGHPFTLRLPELGERFSFFSFLRDDTNFLTGDHAAMAAAGQTFHGKGAAPSPGARRAA